MAGSTEIIQEYLTKIGYVVDQVSAKKFTDTMTVSEKKIMKVGMAAAGMMVAVEAATAAFAYSMRNAYFASELANSSVLNMQAMTYAGKQFGISAADMEGAIHGMAQAFRLNPGLQGLVESFGIKVTGRDVSNVMMDYVKALNKMPEFEASQYAGMFGMSPDTYHMLRLHGGEINKQAQDYKKMSKDMGVDPDQAARVAKEYAAILDRLEAKSKLFGASLMIALLGPFKELAGYIDHLTDRMTEFTNTFNAEKGGTGAKDFKEYAGSFVVDTLKGGFMSGVQGFNSLIGLDAFNHGGPTRDDVRGYFGEKPLNSAPLGTTTSSSTNSSSTVHVDQKVHIVNHGVKDADHITKSAVKTLSTANADLTRHLSGAEK